MVAAAKAPVVGLGLAGRGREKRGGSGRAAGSRGAGRGVEACTSTFPRAFSAVFLPAPEGVDEHGECAVLRVMETPSKAQQMEGGRRALENRAGRSVGTRTPGKCHVSAAGHGGGDRHQRRRLGYDRLLSRAPGRRPSDGRVTAPAATTDRQGGGSGMGVVVQRGGASREGPLPRRVAPPRRAAEPRRTAAPWPCRRCCGGDRPLRGWRRNQEGDIGHPRAEC